jgi:hypothetical protein
MNTRGQTWNFYDNWVHVKGVNGCMLDYECVSHYSNFTFSNDFALKS